MSIYSLDFDTGFLNDEEWALPGALRIEQRRCARFRAPGLQAELQCDGVIYPVAIRDLSLAGCMVIGPIEDVSVAALVHLRACLGRYGEIALPGVVRWVLPEGEEQAVGMRFRPIPPEARFQLADYLLDLWG